MKKLRTAMLAPICWRTPPRKYGPWELVTSLIAEGLIKEGVDLTLFATADSITKGKLESTCVRPTEEDRNLDYKVEEYLHIANIFEKAQKEKYDLIHNQYDFMPLIFSNFSESTLLTTIHGFSSQKILPIYEKYNDKVFYVSISDSDRNEKLDYIKTIYHGIEVDKFFVSEEKKEYLVFLGRIHPEKGTKEAIEVARNTKLPLKIAGIIQDENYFRTEIEPFIDGEQIQYIGPVDPEGRNELFSKAIALLHLISFNEPFGLTMIEAMASGVPVIAFPLGSVPELIVSGQTGFIVKDIQEAVEKVRDIDQIKKLDCRGHVEQNFSVQTMVNKYLELYQEIVHERKGKK